MPAPSPSKTRSNRLKHYRNGLMAEWLAALYCMTKGYLPIAWRVKTPVGEIDLVLRRGTTLVFVEVKARAARDDAAHAVHHKNQSRVVRAAQYFLSRRPNYHHHEVRFDVCLIAWYRWPMHLQNAFH